MFLLLTFLILIASFNVVAILITLVRDRARDIAILAALGTRRRQVVGIFLRLGLVIGAVGTVAGILLGLARSSPWTATVSPCRATCCSSTPCRCTRTWGTSCWWPECRWS